MTTQATSPVTTATTPTRPQVRFATILNPHKVQGQTFKKVRPKYEWKINKKGQKELIQKGETNFYEKIQMYKDNCDIYKIIERAMLGDLSVLEKRVGQYCDTTNMPTNLHECFEYMQNAINNFDALPAEIKEKFNNNPYEFAAASKEDLEKAIEKAKKTGIPKMQKQEEMTETKETKEETKNES